MGSYDALISTLGKFRKQPTGHTTEILGTTRRRPTWAVSPEIYWTAKTRATLFTILATLVVLFQTNHRRVRGTRGSWVGGFNKRWWLRRRRVRLLGELGRNGFGPVGTHLAFPVDVVVVLVRLVGEVDVPEEGYRLVRKQAVLQGDGQEVHLRRIHVAFDIQLRRRTTNLKHGQTRREN